MIDLNVKANGKRVSPEPEIYGIFLEDINYACDGGLNANLVNNYSFDGVYFHAKKKTSMDDPLRYWRISAGKIESGNEDALSANSKYARLTVRPGTKLENLVYNGGVNQDRCAMYIAPGKTYQFRCWLRSDSFAGSVCVHVANSQNKPCDYPFGFGLSYTTFQIDQPELIEVGDDHAQVAVSVTNTGRRAGAEVVQFYAAYPDCPADHPVRTLCGFKKVFLESGERKTVTIRVLLRIHSFSSSIILIDRDGFSSPRVYYEENRKKGADGMTSPFQKT